MSLLFVPYCVESRGGSRSVGFGAGYLLFMLDTRFFWDVPPGLML